MVDRLVLIDGSSLVFRAYFSHPTTFRTAAGLPTNAIYGFASMFRKLLDQRRPTRGAVIFDPRGPTQREAIYAEYKAQRDAMPDALGPQLPWIDRVVEAHGFPTLRTPGWEADDVIGTLARHAEAAGLEVLVVSPDKDFAQLVSPLVRQFVPFADVTYDRALVKKKWGVFPEQIVDLLALVGDAVDDIPGVSGIGAKTAVELLERHGSLDGIYAALATEKPRTAKLLEAGRESALLSRTLATLRLDAPIAEAHETESRPVDAGTLDRLLLPPLDPERLEALYRELEFHSLLRVRAPAPPTGEAVPEPAVVRTEAEIAALIERIPPGAEVALAPVLTGRKPVVARLTRLGLAWGADEVHVLEAELDASPALRAFVEDEARPKLLHGAKPLRVWARARGLTLRGVVFDTRIASFLVDPSRGIPHRLPEVARQVLQRAVPGADPGDAAQTRAEAEVTLALAARLGPELDALGLRAQLVERDLPLSVVLAEMERVGVGVDSAALEGLETTFLARLAGLEAEVHAHAGGPFNLGSTKQLAEVLFETLKLPVVKKTKTGYSTDAEVLERLVPKHPIAGLLLEHRKLEKLVSTYTRVLRESVLPETGRVHAVFEETTSATGRLISTDPDLQRTPVKTPEGKLIRGAFVAAPGFRLVSCDWSQIELRVLAHFSEDPKLIAAFAEGRDVHRETASSLFGVAPADVSREQRNVGKTVNFATIYGQGATALGQILGVPRREAERYIDAYFTLYAGVRAWLDRTIAEAEARGYVETLLGRRRVIPELRATNHMELEAGRRIAANTPIQGSAADLIKVAMVQLDTRLAAAGGRARLVLQIHDEVVLEVPEDEVEAVSRLVVDVMQNAWPLRVPLVAEAGSGHTWADAKA